MIHKNKSEYRIYRNMYKYIYIIIHVMLKKSMLPMVLHIHHKLQQLIVGLFFAICDEHAKQLLNMIR